MASRERTAWGARVSNVLYRRSTLHLLLLLVPPLLWFGTVYLGSLFALLAQSFYTFDDFTTQVVRRTDARELQAAGLAAGEPRHRPAHGGDGRRGDHRLRRSSPFPSPTTWRATPAGRAKALFYVA